MMPKITLTCEQALRKEFIEATIMTKLNPKFGFLGMFPRIDLKGATAFQSYIDDISAEDDIKSGKLSEPVPLSELAHLPEIEVSPISKRMGNTELFGFQFSVSNDLWRDNGKVDDLLRVYDRAGYAMRRKINTDIMNNIKKYAEATPVVLEDGSWTDSNKITEDVVNMQKAFDIIDYDYELTDMYTYKDAWYGVEKYCDSIELKWTPDNIKGVKLHKDDFIHEGLIGLDQKHRPMTIYYNTNPKMSSIAGSIIQVNVVDEVKYPYGKTVEITAEMGIAVKNPKAMLYQPDV